MGIESKARSRQVHLARDTLATAVGAGSGPGRTQLLASSGAVIPLNLSFPQDRLLWDPVGLVHAVVDDDQVKQAKLLLLSKSARAVACRSSIFMFCCRILCPWTSSEGGCTKMGLRSVFIMLCTSMFCCITSLVTK